MNLPPNPKREAPPPDIERTALPVGAQAPAIDLPTEGGGRWSLRDALQRGPAVLVFHRGSW